MTNIDKFIRFNQLSMYYQPSNGLNLFSGDKSSIKAVDQVSLEIGRGEILGIIGESGSGKSTLGRMAAMLEKPTSGEIIMNGVSIENLNRKVKKRLRRSIQIIFQNPFDTFNPRDTVEKIMIRPLQIHGIGVSDMERKKIFSRMLEAGGFSSPEVLMGKYPHELSGGELQRLSILRSLMTEPSLIIADEPVSMLDASIRVDIVNLLIRLSRDKGATVLFISHDLTITGHISDKIAVMYMGRIIEYGVRDEIIKHARHPYTNLLMAYSLSMTPKGKREIIKKTDQQTSSFDSDQFGYGCCFAQRCYKAVPECYNKYPAVHDVGEGHLVACDRIHEEAL